MESARETLTALNPDLNVVVYKERLSVDNIMDIIKDYDIVLDGSDNFPTRFLVNDATYFAKKILISGSIFRFDGQVTTFKHNLETSPCYRCLYPEPPPAGLVPSCQEAGVLGVIAGYNRCASGNRGIKGDTRCWGLADGKADYLRCL